MKRDIKKSVLKAVGKIAETESNMNRTPWPPLCLGILHQPKRPKMTADK